MTQVSSQFQTNATPTSSKSIHIISAQEPSKTGHVVLVLQETNGHDLLAIASEAGPILTTLPPSIQKAPGKLAALLDEVLDIPEFKQNSGNYWIQPGHQVVNGIAYPVAALVSADRLSEDEKLRLTELVLTYMALLQKPVDQRAMSFLKSHAIDELEEAAHKTLLKTGSTKLHAPINLLRESGEKVSELKGRLRTVEPVATTNKPPAVKVVDGRFDGYSIDGRYIKLKIGGKSLTLISVDFGKHHSEVLAVLTNGLSPWVQVKFQKLYVGQTTSDRILISIKLASEPLSNEVN